MQRLSALIGDIYDAALDPSLWGAALGKARGFVGGMAAALYWKDAAVKSGDSFFEDGGIEVTYRSLYFRKYIKLDPSTTAHFFAEIGEPVATTDFIAYDEFIETRFYKEWVQPQGIVDCVNTTLDKSISSVTLFGIFRHERDGLANDQTRHRLRLIVPHLRRSVLIGKVIDLKTAEAAAFADSVDGLSAGMFLVDACGHIVHANASGYGLLNDTSVLRAPGGKLTANDEEAEQALHDVFLAAGNGDAAVGVKGIAVPLAASNGERYVAHVLPLTSGARRRAGTAYRAVAAIFVRKAALTTPSPPEAIAKAYKLTPTELRVLLAIVEIGGVTDVADALGIAESTVKTHLLRLYAKTGASRHADLAKLVAGFSSPLSG